MDPAMERVWIITGIRSDTERPHIGKAVESRFFDTQEDADEECCRLNVKYEGIVFRFWPVDVTVVK